MDVAPETCDGFVLNSTLPPDERLGLAHSLYDLLAEIHLVDPGCSPSTIPAPTPRPASADHWRASCVGCSSSPSPSSPS